MVAEQVDFTHSPDVELKVVLYPLSINTWHASHEQARIPVYVNNEQS